MLAMQAAPVEIVVTGRGLEETAAAPAYGSVTIDRERLTSIPSNRLEDALADVAGLQAFRRSDSRASNPSAQGLTLRALGGNATSRTLVLLDGVPVADPFFGYIPLSALSPDRLSSATVTRGAGSGAFGSGGVAGTIELYSAGADERALLDGQFAAGSREATEFAIGTAPQFDAGFVTFDARWDRGDGFWTTPKDQRAPASVSAAYNARSANARLVTSLGGGNELQLHGLLFRDERTLRFEGADSLSEGADASARLLHRGAWQVDAIAYVQRRNFSNIVVSAASFRPVLDQRRTPSTGIGGKLELRPPQIGALQFRFGSDLRIADGKAVEDVISAATGEVTETRTTGGTTRDLGLFAEVDAEFGKLLLTAGTRADRSNIAGSSDWSLTGRGGALLDLGDVKLRATAYSGLRLPTLNELFRPFVVFPVTTEANDELRPEVVRGIEAGANWNPAPGARIGVTLFANQLRRAIANVTIAPNLRRRDNVDAIRVYGIEADAAATLGRFDMAASLAFNDSRVRDDGSLDGKRPAQTPRFSGSATLCWSNGASRIAATLRHVGAQYEDDLNTDRLPPATTLGLFASHALSPHVELNLRAENLFDERVVTRDQDGSIDLGQPRTFWIGLKLTRPRD
jgi:outer membrane receptor protein involved in Fe transport